MIKMVTSKPNWSKSHPLNDLVLAYDVIEHKLVYVNHYEKMTVDIDYPADEGMLIDDWKAGHAVDFAGRPQYCADILNYWMTNTVKATQLKIEPFENECSLPDDSCTDITNLILGDINQDYTINISDIVLLVAIILEDYNPTDVENNLSDINNDGVVNVVDVVMLVEIIIN